MTSFYPHTPSGFFVETGWGGRIIEADKWQIQVMEDGPSFWGHDRPHLPDEQRRAFRELALGTAKKARSSLMISLAVNSASRQPTVRPATTSAHHYPKSHQRPRLLPNSALRQHSEAVRLQHAS